MGRHEVHLLAFPLDSVKFLLECLGSISEPLLAAWETLIELGVLPPEVALSSAHRNGLAQAISTSTTQKISSSV
jgi:hypothetical protein